MTQLKVFLSVLLACTSYMVIAAPTNGGKLTLRIIHNNDMHSRFHETSQDSSTCTEKNAKESCYGGFARTATLIRQIRNSSTEDLPVLYLNAGDTYQGTKFYSFYKWEIVAKFLNILQPDVASLGNHELDDNVAGLVPFLNNVTFPVVAANLDLSSEPDLANSKQLKNSTILTVKDRKIGVVGYLTPDTKKSVDINKVNYIDEVIALQEEVKKLKTEGVDIIIALGHSGYETDKRIAREVEDVDLVIGGHTNTFLYNGPEPDSEKSEGSYPTVVEQVTGRKVYVVQAYAYTKYLGDVTVEFDESGEITKIEGKPILVDSSVPKAEDVEAELRVWRRRLDKYFSEPVGTSKVTLQGFDRNCKLEECNFGNLLTDAMIHYNAKQFNGSDGWTDAPIALHLSGGIRRSISSLDNDTITRGEIAVAFPYKTHVYKVDVKGDLLLTILEFSVHDRISRDAVKEGNGFLQVSGLQITYNLSQPVGSRVASVKVRCGRCPVPIFQDLKEDQTYSILLTSFMYHGGDGYKMLKGLPYANLNVKVSDIVTAYIKQMSPVYPGVEGRIKFSSDTNCAHLETNISKNII